LNQSLIYIHAFPQLSPQFFFYVPLQSSSKKKKVEKNLWVVAFVPLAAPSVFNLVAFMLFSRCIVLLSLHHTPLAAPQVFVTSLYSYCSLGTLYCCYFIIPLILLIFRRYVPYYHCPLNVGTSLSPVSFCTYVTIPRIALILRRYVSCLTLVTSHLMLCFSSVPLFRSVLSLRRYACVSHCTVV